MLVIFTQYYGLDLEIRIMPVHKYLIFYYIDKTKRIVYIIRVLYHKRDYLDELQIEKR